MLTQGTFSPSHVSPARIHEKLSIGCGVKHNKVLVEGSSAFLYTAFDILHLF